MKTLRITIALATALAASAAFAGPRGKSTPPPAGSATYREAPASTPESGSTMTVKSGKRTSTVKCEDGSAKCRVHCGN
jgi:hypothetical protein